MSRITAINASFHQSIRQSIAISKCVPLVTSQRRSFAKINRSGQSFKPRTFGRHTSHEHEEQEEEKSSADQSKTESTTQSSQKNRSYTAEQQRHQSILDSIHSSQKESARIKEIFEDSPLFEPVVGMIGFNNQDLEYEPATQPFDMPEKEAYDPMGDPVDNSTAHYLGANIRMRTAAREVIGRKLYDMAVLRSYNPAYSKSVDLRDIPIHFHRISVSTDLQFITAEWALEPNVPGTSKVTLPAKYKSFGNFQSIIREIGVILSLSIKQIRFDLGEKMSTKYVPQLRFVYDQKALREERSHEASVGDVTEAQIQDFELFNPFFSTSHERKQRTVKKRDTSSRVVSEVTNKKSRREQKQKKRFEEIRREKFKEGTKDGVRLYATNQSDGAIDLGIPTHKEMRLKGNINVPAFHAYVKRSRDRE